MNQEMLSTSGSLIGVNGCPSNGIIGLGQAKANFEAAYLKQLLSHTNGNVAKAAQLAGRFRSDMYRLFTKHGIVPETSRDSMESESQEPALKNA